MKPKLLIFSFSVKWKIKLTAFKKMMSEFKTKRKNMAYIYIYIYIYLFIYIYIERERERESKIERSVLNWSNGHLPCIICPSP